MLLAFYPKSSVHRRSSAFSAPQPQGAGASEPLDHGHDGAGAGEHLDRDDPSSWATSVHWTATAWTGPHRPPEDAAPQEEQAVGGVVGQRVADAAVGVNDRSQAWVDKVVKGEWKGDLGGRSGMEKSPARTFDLLRRRHRGTTCTSGARSRRLVWEHAPVP